MLDLSRPGEARNRLRLRLRREGDRRAGKRTDVMIDHESQSIRQITLKAENRISIEQLSKVHLSSFERSTNLRVNLELGDGQLEEGRGLVSLETPERSFVGDGDGLHGFPSESERLLCCRTPSVKSP